MYSCVDNQCFLFLAFFLIPHVFPYYAHIFEFASCLHSLVFFFWGWDNLCTFWWVMFVVMGG